MGSGQSTQKYSTRGIDDSITVRLKNNAESLRRQGKHIGFVPRREINLDGSIPPADEKENDKAENKVK
jgi:hypothetical protein